MVQKNWRILLILLVVVLLAAFVLTACETAGQPQPTATSKPSTSKPTSTSEAPPDEVPPTPTSAEGYPTPLSDEYPTP